MTYRLSVNGSQREVDAAADMPLLWVLREKLGLLGTKFGCGMAMCGACTVHIDGVPVRSCSVAIADVQGEITTIEGLKGRVIEVLQDAWIDHDVPQCGYCQVGQLMSATALLKENGRPDDAMIDSAMSGNLCRCGTYTRIRAAIIDAGEKLARTSGAQ